MYCQVIVCHFILLLSTTAVETLEANSSCFNLCNCSMDENSRVSARCSIREYTSSAMDDIRLPEALFSLDLSYTNVSSLGKGAHQLFSNLQNLVVEHSGIASPEYWVELLKLPSIRLVSGVSWAKSCDQCNITTDKELNVPKKPCDNCSEVRMFYRKGISFDRDTGEICSWISSQGIYYSPSRYLRPGYTLQCMCNPGDCVTKLPLDTGAVTTRRLQRHLDSLYPLSSVALVLNLVVIAVISASKSLRKITTLFLTLNMAICDLLICVFCMLTASFNVLPDDDQEVMAYTYSGCYPDLQSFILMCPYMSFIFSVTQFTSVMTSLLLSVEKYLAIVYCLKPGIRMTRKLAVICVCVTWCVAVAYNMLVIFFVGDKERKADFSGTILCAASIHNIGGYGISASQLLAFVYILVFLCTIPLYIHMYIVVRKSSTQTGVKREGALARRLALVVVTNLVFSVVPLSQLPFLGVIRFENFSVSIHVVWLPFFLLCLNSLLNPFLFAFRHYLFKSHLRQAVSRITQCTNGGATTGQQHNVRHHQNRVKHKETPL